MLFALSALLSAERVNEIKLFPTNAKPRKNTATLTSTENRVGTVVYQAFHPRNDPSREAFRVDIGSYEKGQLVEDWNYGIILERDVNGDGIPDYVWYGGDDTGQRLLLFLSKDTQYDCINVFKSAEAVWKKKFGKTAPDLGEVGGDQIAKDVTWNLQTQVLTVSAVPNDLEKMKTQKRKVEVGLSEFVHSER